MVLRKRFSGISFVHAYQRVVLLWSWFLVCKYCCGGDGYFGAMVSSFVQIFTYGYYLLALLKIACPWKR